MTRKIPVLTSALLAVLLLSSCGANIFSWLNPSIVDIQNDVNVLVAMGDDYLVKGSYTNAYYAYTRALQFSPSNCRALEGSSTAIVYMYFNFTNLYNAIMTSNYSILGPNNLYRVGGVVSRNLGRIIFGENDGQIPRGDVNINLNYFIFNSFYSIFGVADTDNDSDIRWDTNDYIILDDNLNFSNRILEVLDDAVLANNLVPFVGMAYKINYIKRRAFVSSQSNSLTAIGVVAAALDNESTLSTVLLISNSFAGYISSLDTYFTFFDTNTLLTIPGNPTFADVANNLFPATYDDLTNEVALEGIWPPSEITNAFPDMTSVYPELTNKYNRPEGLD